MYCCITHQSLLHQTLVHLWPLTNLCHTKHSSISALHLPQSTAPPGSTPRPARPYPPPANPPSSSSQFSLQAVHPLTQSPIRVHTILIHYVALSSISNLCHQGWPITSYNSVQCGYSSETADQGHRDTHGRTKAAYDQYSERRDSAQISSRKDAGTTSFRSQQHTTGHGHTDTSSTLWSIRHAPSEAKASIPLNTGSLMSCTGNYPATSLWVHRCISEPALSRNSQVSHAGK